MNYNLKVSVEVCKVSFFLLMIRGIFVPYFKN